MAQAKPWDKKKTKSGISVFDYTDYRTYLAEYYEDQKARKTGFSYRTFSKKAGINSVGLYKDVVEGRQNLGRGLISKFSETLGHGKREAAYFEDMVYFCEVRTMDERKLYFKKMMASYESKAYKVDSDKFEYYSKWYYSAIRALISCVPVKDNYKAIAKALNPTIRPDQVKKAIQVLERLGFIRMRDDGYYEVTEPVITSGYQKPDKKVQLFNLINYQKTMLEMAGKAYDINPLKAIDMSTLTLSVSKQTYKEIKKEIADVRSRIAAMAARDKNPDRVYQMSYKLFPLTRVNGEEK
jgi:uncharacterized protein (TIGR02147 family)